jgi:hypothetical protein
VRVARQTRVEEKAELKINEEKVKPKAGAPENPKAGQTH